MGTRARAWIACLLSALLVLSSFGATADAKKRRKRVRHRRPPAARVVRPPAVPATVSACPGADDVPTAANLDAARVATLCLVNNERARVRLPALRENGALAGIARGHSLDMVARQYFEHTSPTGSTLLSRLLGSGYARTGVAWMAGENIGWASGLLSTPAAIVTAWMNSPGHRANILRAEFRDVGTGIAAGAPRGGVSGPAATYTQDFGSLG